MDGFEDYFNLAIDNDDAGYSSSSVDMDDDRSLLPIDFNFSPNPRLCRYYMGYLRRYCRGKICKKDATSFWDFFKEFSIFPSHEVKSFDTLLRKVFHILPEVTVTWKVKNVHTGKYFTGHGKGLPYRRYGNRNNYEFVEVWSRITVMDTIRLHAALHEDDCDFVVNEKIDYSRVKITFTCDGIPHGKSSPDSLHVLALKVNNCKLVHIVHARVARRKESKELDDFLDPIVEECNRLGIQVRFFVADSPMRSFFKRLKGHAGRSSCEMCEATGVCVSRKIVYPACQVQQPRRTHEKWVECLQDLLSQREEGHQDHVKGIMGRSPLLDLNNFDIVEDSPTDPLHRDWLGIVKATLWRQTTGMSKTGSMTVRGQRIANAISESYSVLRIPSEFSHCARPIDYPNFKSHEWKSLLVTSFPTICDVVNNEIGEKCAHIWLLYSFLILLYYGPDRNYESLPAQDLEDLHQQLYDEFEEEFGQAACTFNWHCFYHMPRVRSLGLLSDMSTESFESAYGMVQKSYAPGTRNTSLQIVRNMCMRSLGHTSDFCQHKLTIDVDKGNKNDDSILIDDHYNYYQVKSIRRNGMIMASPIKTSLWECPHDPTLPFDSVGVKMYDEVSDITVQLPSSHFQGKGLIRNDGVMIPFHKELLFS